MTFLLYFNVYSTPCGYTSLGLPFSRRFTKRALAFRLDHFIIIAWQTHPNESVWLHYVTLWALSSLVVYRFPLVSSKTQLTVFNSSFLCASQVWNLRLSHSHPCSGAANKTICADLREQTRGFFSARCFVPTHGKPSLGIFHAHTWAIYPKKNTFIVHLILSVQKRFFGHYR